MRVASREGFGMDVCHSLVQGTVSGFATDGCHSLFRHTIPGSGKDSCQGLFHHISTHICTDIQYILEMRDSHNQTSGIQGFREAFPHKNFLNIYFLYRARYQVLTVVTTGIDDVSWDVMPWSLIQMFQQEPAPSITIDLQWRWRQQVPLKHQYTSPKLQCHIPDTGGGGWGEGGGEAGGGGEGGGEEEKREEEEGGGGEEEEEVRFEILGLICLHAEVTLSSYWVAARFWWLLKTVCFYWAVYWGTYTLVKLQALCLSIRSHLHVAAILNLSICRSRMFNFTVCTFSETVTPHYRWRAMMGGMGMDGNCLILP